MQPVEREGQFKALITEYGLYESDHGALMMRIKANLTDMWDGEQWASWSDYQMESTGGICVVKKDGSLHQPGIESLMKFAGWDGNFESAANGSWNPTPCQVAVKREEYKGAVEFRINFVNSLDRTPGQLGNVTPDKAKELQNRFGSQLRALAGNAKRTTTPTGNGRPPAPPPAPPRVPATAAPVQYQDGDDVPF